MAFRLLELASGGVSLEFEPTDRSRLRDAIEAAFGKPKEQRQILFVNYRFGGCEFIYYDEWDEPCLISETPEGSKVLRTLFGALVPQDAP